jgi:hypothetical protein
VKRQPIAFALKSERVQTLRVAVFTVKATTDQSARWKQAAEAHGQPSVGAWLADAADSYLRQVARGSRPVKLVWRNGVVRVVRMDGKEIEEAGRTSPPFGILSGNLFGRAYAGGHAFTLVYLPERKVLATLSTARECRIMASELAPQWARVGDGAL